MLGISQIILTEAALGFALQLTVVNLSILNVVISICILIFAGAGRREPLRQLKEARSVITGLLNLLRGNRILSIIFFLFQYIQLI